MMPRQVEAGLTLYEFRRSLSFCRCLAPHHRSKALAVCGEFQTSLQARCICPFRRATVLESRGSFRKLQPFPLEGIAGDRRFPELRHFETRQRALETISPASTFQISEDTPPDSGKATKPKARRLGRSRARCFPRARCAHRHTNRAGSRSIAVPRDEPDLLAELEAIAAEHEPAMLVGCARVRCAVATRNERHAG